MRAVKLALLHFNLHSLSTVLVSTDNTTVMSYINKEGGTRSTSLWEETQDLFKGGHVSPMDPQRRPHVDLFATRLNCKL